MLKHKEHQPKLLRSNVVYKLTCSCDSVYIGQTRRNLRARLDDHNPAANSNQQSDVAKHLLENLRKVTIYLLTSCNTEERIAQNIYIYNSNRNYKN